MKPSMILTFALLVLVMLASSGAGPTDPRPEEPDKSVVIIAEPLTPPAGYEGLNGLRLVSALKLTANDEDFGGWSGLSMQADGSFVALSDRAVWLMGKITQNDEGGVTGVNGAKMGVLRDTDGQQPYKERGDSEGVTRMKDGRYAVSFELLPRISFYDLDKDGSAARPKDGPRLSEVKQLNRNQQLEAITTLSDGSLLVGSERGVNGDDEALLWRVPPLLPKAQSDGVAPLTAIKLPPSFSLTELAGAPDGSFYALYRAYSPLGGAAAQIWHFHFSEADGKTSAVGELLAQIKPPSPTDNYEAMALTTSPNGAQHLFVLSDDNYRDAQETILLTFEILEKAPN
jgi:hypothetical protein